MRRHARFGWVLCAVALGCGDGTAGSDGGFDAARAHDAALAPDGAAAADLAVVDQGPSIENRILLLVETSEGMSAIDKNDSRGLTVTALLSKHVGQPFPMFAVVSFDSLITEVTPGFTSVPDIAAVNVALGRADDLTDDEGALDKATQMIEKDALAIPAGERMRTHYTVAILAGSLPDPECNATAVPCGQTTCAVGSSCRVGACRPNELICTLPRDQWAMDNVDMSWFPSLMNGMDYNTSARLTQKVQALSGLAAKDQIGGVTVDTALIFDPNVQGDPLLAPFGLDRPQSIAFLKSLAQAGGGNSYDLNAMPMLPY